MTKLLFFAFLVLCKALIKTDELSLDGAYGGLAASPVFGFDAGGYVYLEATITSLTPALIFNNSLVFKLREALVEAKSAPTERLSCISTSDITLGFPKLGMPLVANFTIPERKLYYLVALQCDSPVPLTVSYSLQFINPGPSQLSYGDSDLPGLYWYFTGLWLLLLGLQSLYYVRFFARSNPFHVVLVVLTASKTAVSTIRTLNWSAAERGDSSDSFQLAASIVFSISEALLFATLLLAARGWHITFRQLPQIQVNGIFGALILIVVSLLFLTIYEREYYFLGFLIMYFFMLPKVFAALATSQRTLDSAIFAIRRRGGQVDPGLSVKLRFFASLRLASIYYLLHVLIVSSAELFLPWYLTWIFVIYQEVSALVMVGWLANSLRPNTQLFDDIPLPNIVFEDLFPARNAPVVTTTTFKENNVEIISFPGRSGVKSMAIARFSLEPTPID